MPDVPLYETAVFSIDNMLLTAGGTDNTLTLKSKWKHPSLQPRHKRVAKDW